MKWFFSILFCALLIGISESTLFRLEQGEQNATLKMLQNLMDRLHCSIGDIFGA